MTKGDLLRILGPLPLKTEIISRIDDDCGHGEIVLTHAYTVTGRDGLCVVLCEGPMEAVVREEYDNDVEQVWP